MQGTGQGQASDEDNQVVSRDGNIDSWNNGLCQTMDNSHALSGITKACNLDDSPDSSTIPPSNESTAPLPITFYSISWSQPCTTSPCPDPYAILEFTDFTHPELNKIQQIKGTKGEFAEPTVRIDIPMAICMKLLQKQNRPTINTCIQINLLNLVAIVK